jgi:hypothetical protein
VLNSSQTKRTKPAKSDDDGFIRFSATAFANVIYALTPHQRNVIESYGFGSLLQFSKCYVPKKFVTWIAWQVDSKSGDIILGGKVTTLYSFILLYFTSLTVYKPGSMGNHDFFFVLKLFEVSAFVLLDSMTTSFLRS